MLGPSEQADEAELAEDALVVVELGVGGALFLRDRDLRAVLVTTVNFPFVTTQNFSLWACR